MRSPWPAICQRCKSQLQQLLDATQQANASAQKVQGSAEQAQATAAQAQQSASEAQRTADQASTNATDVKTALSVVDSKTKDDDKRLSALQDILGRFRFVGDVRLRGEDLFQDCPTCITRNRARLRLRFGVDGKLNEDFTGGFVLASGSLGDSNSTNETLTNFFTRKRCEVLGKRRNTKLDETKVTPKKMSNRAGATPLFRLSAAQKVRGVAPALFNKTRQLHCRINRRK